MIFIESSCFVWKVIKSRLMRRDQNSSRISISDIFIVLFMMCCETFRTDEVDINWSPYLVTLESFHDAVCTSMTEISMFSVDFFLFFRRHSFVLILQTSARQSIPIKSVMRENVKIARMWTLQFFENWILMNIFRKFKLSTIFYSFKKCLFQEY